MMFHMWIKSFVCSSIGKKLFMAVTGLILSGFLIAHLAGNLLLYCGSEAFNNYAHTMKANVVLLWTVRSVLLIAFPLHVYFALSLSLQKNRARPVGYKFNNTVRATFASRTMILTGMLLLAFILYHLSHYTLMLVNPEFGTWLDAKGRPDAYRMAVTGFQYLPNVIFYVFSMVVLGLHLSHGLSSLFQSLGINHNKYNGFIRTAGPVLAFTLMAGFISLPISVMLGVIS